MVLIKQNSRIHSRNRARINGFISYIIPKEKKSPFIVKKKLFNIVNSRKIIMTIAKIFGILFLYSMAMFTLPFVTFFSIDYFLKHVHKIDDFTSNCLSVLAAVVVVNLIIACYAYQALHEHVPEESKDDNEEINQAPLLTGHNIKSD